MIIKLDKQDDAAAYTTFCSANFKQCLTHEIQVKEGMEGIVIYLFIMGIYDIIFVKLKLIIN